MDEQRAEFEAWAKQAGWPHHATMPINKGPDYFSDMSLAVWQAATQRQQERIAAMEAQVLALSLDAGRLDWLTFHLSGKALRDIGVIWSEHADARAAIDAAIAAGKGEG